MAFSPGKHAPEEANRVTNAAFVHQSLGPLSEGDASIFNCVRSWLLTMPDFLVIMGTDTHFDTRHFDICSLPARWHNIRSFARSLRVHKGACNCFAPMIFMC